MLIVSSMILQVNHLQLLSGSKVSYKIINNTAGAWTTVVLFFIISILGKFLDSQLLFLNP